MPDEFSGADNRMRVLYRDPDLLVAEYRRDRKRLREILRDVGATGWVEFGGAGGCIMDLAGPFVPRLRRELEAAIRTEGLRIEIVEPEDS